VNRETFDRILQTRLKAKVDGTMNAVQRYIFTLLGLGITILAAAAGQCAQAQTAIGQIKNLTGQVFIIRNDVQHAARAGDLIEHPDVLTTGPNGSVGITFIDDSRFSAGPNSRIEIGQFKFDPTRQQGEFLTIISRGTLAIVSGQIAKSSPEAMKVKTPTTVLGVRGTTFAVKVED
jgi:hypothetical protein